MGTPAAVVGNNLGRPRAGFYTVTGYSGTPLAQKLGIKAGFEVWTVDAPDGFVDLLEPLPDGATVTAATRPEVDMAIVFATTRTEMENRFVAAMRRVGPDGAIWVAWPKRSSGVPTNLSGDVMRELFLPTGMVDNKVCAMDSTWSGLRFVVRKENRATWNP